MYVSECIYEYAQGSDRPADGQCGDVSVAPEYISIEAGGSHS